MHMDIPADAGSLAVIGMQGQQMAPACLSRLWPSLTAAWTRRLDRRIEDDLQGLDHAGVLEDFRRASRG